MPAIADTLQLAQQQHQAGQFQQAEQLYRQILQADPQQADAWNCLGILACETGRAELAVEYLRTAIQLHEDVAAFHYNLGLAYQDLGRLNEAVNCYQRTLQLRPGHGDAAQNLAVLLSGPGFGQQTAAQLQPELPAAKAQPATIARGQGSDTPNETDRRKAVIARRESDRQRWRDPAQLESAWNARASLAADFIPAGATVLDLGCGSMALEKMLPFGAKYVPCDLVARDDRTLVCDLNAGEFPAVEGVSHVAVLGVLEYLYDAAAFLRQLRQLNVPVVLSYNPADFTKYLDRPGLGWVNHFSFQELKSLLQEADFAVRTSLRADNNQMLLRLAPAEPIATRTASVLVLSCLNMGNFGDRLGYHLINGLLPEYATVSHAHFDFRPDRRRWDLPEGDFDLLVLGIGNSLFRPLLTDELLRLLDRVPRAVGIFGTQYRQDIDTTRLDRILDRLEHWYARYEEDLLLYGKACHNVTHLGDWLIDAFAMARGEHEGQPLVIGDEIWQPLPLDRTIQRIQSYQRVLSTRLHPLLCALTSAEQVAYREQREAGSNRVSGKFRSMLLDIFGHTFPEEEFFVVDRDAVIAYKTKVRATIAAVRRTLAELLAPGGCGSC